MSPRLASAITSSPAAARLGDEPLELGHARRAVPLEERDLRLDHRRPLRRTPRRTSRRTARSPSASSRSPHDASSAADGSMPAHSGPVRRTAAATRSPKLSAISSSFVEQMATRLRAVASSARRPPARRHLRHRAAARPNLPHRRAVRVAPARQLARAPSTAPAGPGRSPCPTCTASAPAQQLDRVAARRTPRRRRRSARRGRRPGTPTPPARPPGGAAAPERPPPPAPSTGAPVSVSRARPSSVLTRVSPSAPPSRAPAAISTMSGTFGLSLAQRGRPHAVAASTARGRLGRVGEHPRAVLHVGAAHVHLERHDAPRPSAEAAAATAPRRGA